MEDVDQGESAIGQLLDMTRRPIGGLLACAAILTLCGCTATSQIAARSVDGGVEFLFCEDIDADQVEVREPRTSASDPLHTLWIADGKASMEGRVVIYGVDPTGTETQVGPEPITENVVVFARTFDASGEINESVQGTFTLEEMKSGDWVMADGRTLDAAPC